MFGRNKRHDNIDFGEIGTLMMFTVMVNMAKKLNITPEEFYTFMSDMDGAHDFLHDLHKIKREDKESE